MSTVLDAIAGSANGLGSGNGSPTIGHRPNVIVHSAAMREVFRLVSRVAKSTASVLIQGESGTGKELVAREIHAQSGRSGSFISINCAAIPLDLLESSLFGHVRGSFTGAYKDSIGLMRAAQGGTFLLDEVSGMPLATQAKLLRALQEREVLPVGGTKSFPIDCRIVAATNTNLSRQITEGRFRSDLLYRLNVIDLTLPPLRERSEDIPLLITLFLNRFCGGTPPSVPAEVLERLQQYPWPGNIRQLENAIERAVVLCAGDEIRLADLPQQVVTGSLDTWPENIDPLHLRTLAEVEREHVIDVCRYTGGNQRRAAAILGLNPSTVCRKMRSYGL